MTFKTQQEIWEALIAGKTVINNETKHLLKLIEGITHEKLEGNEQWRPGGSAFQVANRWSLVEEPRVIWVNVYKKGLGFVYDNKEEAETCITNGGVTKKFIEVIE